ncbi:MAG: serpin family protein, partial [Bacteroidota bacterium]|nr:serpin family protein [Bacteroidota bacterium]
MIVMLPRSGVSIDSLVNNMNHNNWKTWMEGFYNRPDFDVFLPKFTFEFEKELEELLSQLGMEIAFDPNGSADFSKINPDIYLYISSVKHKTFIEVNEEGTEAAAVTSVTFGTTSVGPSNEFRADHPFIFVINEKFTNAIMFMGKVTDPEADS